MEKPPEERTRLDEFFSHRARALLVADPDTDPALVKFVQDLLANGGTGAEQFQTTGPNAYYEEMMAATLEDHIDAVVVLRFEPTPSREVLTAVRLARAEGKPIQALVVPDISAAVDVDETLPIQLDPSWAGRQELYRWGATFAQRYGHPIP
jgi:hypothetical protein